MSHNKTRAINVVAQTIEGRERSFPRYRGWLKAIDGSVHVSGRPGYVYVQRRDVGESVQTEQVRMVDVNVPDIDGFPIVVGRNDISRTEDTVLSRDMDVDVSWLYDYVVKGHREQHEVGGFDTVYIYDRAMISLRVSAQSTPNTTVKINAGTHSTLTGNAYFEGTSAYQMSTCIPDWGQRWCLLGINQETRELYTIAGSIISAASSLTISNLPTIPHDMVTLAAIQMYRGQTTIEEDNIFDLRVVAGGWAGTLEVRDDHITVVDAATILDFTGAGVTVTELSSGYAVIHIPGGAAGGTFLGLTDTPGSYVGEAGKAALVNAGENALEFVDVVTETEFCTGKFAHWLGVDPATNVARWQPDNPAVLHAGAVTEYSDIDDAFAAMVAGDKLLVPPGDWEMTALHSITDISVVGLGGAPEDCRLYSTITDAGTLISLNTSGTIYNVYVDWDIANSNNNHVGVDVNPGCRAYFCVVDVAIAAGTGNAYALQVESAVAMGYARQCTTCAATVNSGLAIGINSINGDVRYCGGIGYAVGGTATGITCQGQWEAFPLYDCYGYATATGIGGGTYYGLYFGAGGAPPVYVSHCYFEGSTSDVYGTASTGHFYSVRYESEVLAAGAVINCESGDRAGKSRDETITGAWIFNNVVDVNGNKIDLDANGDTSITADTDDEIDIEVAGADKIKITATAIEGVASSEPDLGTTTAAEMWGNVYLAADKDAYARANDYPLGTREGGLINWTWHFDGLAALPAGFAWAGAPFVTPVTINYVSSALELGHNAIARWFLYRSIDVTDQFIRTIMVSNARTVGNYWGLRMDDGTDNNYVEATFEVTNYPPTQITIYTNHRTGGGGVTQTAGTAMEWPGNVYLEGQITGTKWANWAWMPKVLGLHGYHGRQTYWQNGVAGRAWTPTRVGMVFYNVDATAWYRYWIDAYNLL